MRSNSMTNLFATLLLCTSAATAMTNPESHSTSEPHHLQKRVDYSFADSYSVFKSKRDAHACMMSLVFIVLLPLGAISMHIPQSLLHRLPTSVQKYIGHRVSRIHAPIQLLALAMMIGAMGLGIDIARNDLHFLGPGSSKVRDGVATAHITIGLLVTSAIIAVQPIMGILQHRYFKRTQGKSVFAYIHRWIGRIMIILGWVNSGLGFRLYELVTGEQKKTSSWVRNFVLMGVLGGTWFALVAIDGRRKYFGQGKHTDALEPVKDQGMEEREAKPDTNGSNS